MTNNLDILPTWFTGWQRGEGYIEKNRKGVS